MSALAVLFLLLANSITTHDINEKKNKQRSYVTTSFVFANLSLKIAVDQTNNSYNATINTSNCGYSVPATASNILNTS